MSQGVDEILRRLRRDSEVHGVRRIQWDDVKSDMMGFYREFVAGRKPCVVEGALESWKGLWEWDIKGLKAKMSGKKVTVAVTPNGRADALTEVGGEMVFMRPDEQMMLFDEFIDGVHAPTPNRTLYAQKQNDSFMEEYHELHDDITDNIHMLGCNMFGSLPEAVNFWLGGDETVSSMHRDHYENLYAVVRGSKTFVLVPPWESSCVPYTSHPEGVWREDTSVKGSFTVERLETSVKWVELTPNTTPSWEGAHPLSVTVSQGDLLYLPSLWYHEVRQQGGLDGITIAVNYWWDINYDATFWTLEAIRRMGTLSKGEPLSEDEE
eukprot:TRINITY_DN15201_c0_g1_i1.p1 TRINITY_DN15201_c0_g1~~TRINITY_DN15201_c0_g1_i1.p1  ORF type:complete len:335 (+),score=46.43 TRINITY_DN15201_c0_g1_i1:40-1005(+)